ncbi:MAG: hypothetical protein ACREA9_07790 [Pyrinomonadaceae bacterium]
MSSTFFFTPESRRFGKLRQVKPSSSRNGFARGIKRGIELRNPTSFLMLVLLSVISAGCADKVHPTNGGTGENGVLVDGTKSASFQNDQRFTGTAGNDIGVGQFTTTGEVIGYTNEHPPTLLPNVAWTSGDDTANLNFENKYRVPFFVWIVKGPFAAQQGVAINACVKTSQIWGDERQGIGFSTFTITDATANANAANFFAFTCGQVANIKSQIGFNAGGVNIYYVDTVDFGSGAATTNGVWCGGNVVAMGRNASDHLFSHEIGHAFSLDHVNSLTTFFDTTNVMHNASNNRNFLTEGQTFRAVVNSGSVINNAYNARPGLVTRNCGNSTDTTIPDCPPVQKRIWADGAIWPPN